MEVTALARAAVTEEWTHASSEQAMPLAGSQDFSVPVETTPCLKHFIFPSLSPVSLIVHEPRQMIGISDDLKKSWSLFQCDRYFALLWYTLTFFFSALVSSY